MADKNQNRPLIRFNFLWIYGAIALFIVGWSLIGQSGEKPLESDWTMVEKLVEQGEVERIRIVNRDKAEVFLAKEAVERYRQGSDEELKLLPEKGVQILFTIPSVDAFREDLKQAEAVAQEPVPVIYQNDKRNWLDIVGGILPWVLIIAVWFFIMRSMARGIGGGGAGGIMNVGKARPGLRQGEQQACHLQGCSRSGGGQGRDYGDCRLPEASRQIP